MDTAKRKCKFFPHYFQHIRKKIYLLEGEGKCLFANKNMKF